MKKLSYADAMNKSAEHISGDGAFLVAASHDTVNTMTIGWATVGYVWGMPVMMVAVRPSRHTFGIIEKAPDFSVSVPLHDMKKELAFCGSRSGRDCDKFQECALERAPATAVAVPVIRIPGIHFECTIVGRTHVDPARLSADVKKFYAVGDYHTLYFGRIEAAYEM